MVKLRLRRAGKKKLAIYKIVAADSRAPRDGRFIEMLGTYDPNLKPMKIDINEERVFHWLRSGALPTDTVKNLLSRKGVMLKLHMQKKKADDGKIKHELEKWAELQGPKSEREALKKKSSRDKRKSSKTKGQKEPEEVKAEQPAAAENAPAEGQ